MTQHAHTTSGDDRSYIETLSDLSPDELREAMSVLNEEQALRLMFDWHSWARPAQRIPPGTWTTWLLNSGRGAGKTRTGAETCREWVEEADGPIRLHLIAETAADARDVLVEGESGILAISPPWNMPKYEPSKRRLTWPNGSMGTLFAGEEPGQLRGPQAHKAWADELAKYRYPQETWDNLELGLRLGDNPQVVVTTTPRPIKIIKDLLADEDTVVSSESSYANISNLAPKYIRRVIKKYEGTRLGAQELHAKILESAKGALWSTKIIDRNRVRNAPPMRRIVVSVDPSTTSNEEEGTPNECGITVLGLGEDGLLYMLRDASKVMSPGEWGSLAVTLFRLWNADCIVAERNQGGEMVRATIQTVDPNVPVKLVWASQGKTARAEPVAALTEQGKVKFVGQFAELEDQLTSMMPDKTYLGKGSPDRADSFVWGATELMLQGGEVSTNESDYADYKPR